MTYADWLSQTAKKFEPISTTPRLDANLLLGHATGLSKAQLLAYPETALSALQLGKLKSLYEQRISGMPIAYITGTKEFCGHSFVVNKHVLVPRPESESFIELLLQLHKTERIHNVTDIGTGSGALAISAKLALPSLHITATDASARALAVAAKNSLGLAAPITLRKQSLLTGDKEGYDVVLANLPYVPTNTTPSPSIAAEPAMALFSGPDGLTHYRALFKQLAPKYIRFVMTESLESQHLQVVRLAQLAGYGLTKSVGLVQLFTKVGDVTKMGL